MIARDWKGLLNMYWVTSKNQPGTRSKSCWGHQVKQATHYLQKLRMTLVSHCFKKMLMTMMMTNDIDNCFTEINSKWCHSFPTTNTKSQHERQRRRWHRRHEACRHVDSCRLFNLPPPHIHDLSRSLQEEEDEQKTCRWNSWWTKQKWFLIITGN